MAAARKSRTFSAEKLSANIYFADLARRAANDITTNPQLRENEPTQAWFSEEKKRNIWEL